MIQCSPGMPADAYDGIIAHLAQPLRSSEGFISHAAEITPDGVTVTEVWEPAGTGNAGTPHPSNRTSRPTLPNRPSPSFTTRSAANPHR